MSEQQINAPGLKRQREIYLGGYRGKKTPIPFTYPELEQAAFRSMQRTAFNYIAAGAGDSSGISQNEAAFKKYSIVPRVLNDVERSDMSASFAGIPLKHPIILSPVGVLSLAHSSADIGVASAAEASHTPMIFSNQASVKLEDIAAQFKATPYWFQLYWSRSDDLVRSFVERAERCGCRGIIVTLDTTMLGWRPLDLGEAYLPFLHGLGLAQYISDPIFNRLVDEAPDEQPKEPITLRAFINVMKLMKRYPGGFISNFKSKRPLKAVRLFTRIYTNPRLNWSDLSKLREYTNLPIFLKGVLAPEDAKKAKETGIDGIIVSNHGGRQVEGAIPPILQLAAIRKSVGQSFPVALDSGVRTGADIFKAINLGADAVCIGRPYVYALALGGQAGVEEYLKNLIADLDLTMKLSGCRSIDEIRATTLKTL